MSATMRGRYSCVKSPYRDQNTARHEIERINRLEEKRGVYVKRLEYYCTSCLAWHIKKDGYERKVIT